MKLKKHFSASKVNRSVDERLLPEGELIDVQNVRINSSEDGEGGSAENVVSNLKLTDVKYNGQSLSSFATTLCAFAWPKTDTIYWFVTDYILGVDMILSYKNGVTNYHIVSTSVLNFDQGSRIVATMIDDFLFFTDDRNPPRYIDVTKNYLKPISNVDRITEDDISVIVKPPIFPPTITAISSSANSGYMEDKFIRFATRYRYANGQYSAISTATNPVFTPGTFQLDYETYDMVGMLNVNQKAVVQFGTGPRQVVAIDVLFKLSHENFWNVIERFNKEDQGWGNEETKTVEFDRRKIQTTLSEAETLRNFDNVPLQAKAQTAVGNRILYGNYLEGRDIDTVMDFSTELISVPINGTDLDPNSLDYDYDTYEARQVSGAGIEFDMGDLNLKQGAILFLDFNFEHAEFGGDPSYPASTTNDFTSRIGISLAEDYSFVVQFYQSASFQSAIGGGAAQPIGSCSDGATLDDEFNCSISPATGWTYEDTSQFILQLSGTKIRIYPPVVRYEDNGSPGTYAYEYFYNVASRAYFRELGNNTSCHSDRDLETALVYMDDHGRSTTSLVAKENVVSVPKNASDKKNSLRMTIKHTPPSWAKYFKVVVKPSSGAYETIYSNIFFKDSKSGTWFVKLLGDNISKANEGDRLIVKRDGGGIDYQQTKTKILSKGVKEENFINPNDSTGPQEPSGVYMEVNGNFSIDEDEESFVSYGTLASATDSSAQIPGTVEREGIPLENPEDSSVDWYRSPVSNGLGCALSFPAYVNEGTIGARVYSPYDIPEGSLIRFHIEHFREGGDDYYRYLFDEEFVATRDYANLYEFIVGENVDFTNPTNDPEVESDTVTPTAEWDADISGNLFPSGPLNNTSTGLLIQYCRVPGGGTDGQDIEMLGFQSGPDRYFGRNSRLNVKIDVRRSVSLLVFETEPADTDGRTFYDCEGVYEIEGGFHKGTVQDQTASQDCIIDVPFYDCYTFGNGVESMKVRDALDGRPLDLGARTYIVTEENYQQIRRYADITYSGVYNFDTNVNKLNSFNLALANFKPLDRNFGSIQVLDAGRDNILCLQEDKISYVLANGKDLFSDAAGGGAILNVPQVLGQQIARFEDFGISQDPESYVRWGRNAFFTDAKRNAVINLSGGGTPEEPLDVISNIEMRPWFRNLFRDSGDVFRLGAWDPFHNEYVFSNTSMEKDPVLVKTSAGVVLQGEVTSEAETFEVALGRSVGTVDIPYEVDLGEVLIVVEYNGSEVIRETVTGSGTLSFDKDESSVEDATLNMSPTEATYSLSVNPVDVDEFTVIKVAANSFVDEGETVHADMYVTRISPEVVTNAPISSDIVVMKGSEVGLFSSETGAEGTGNIPQEGDTIVMQSVKKDGDTYRWGANDRLMYHYSDTLYTQEEVISTLRPLMKSLFPVSNTEDGVYQATHEYSNPDGKQYLYLLWDYYPQELVSNDPTFDETTETFDTTEITFDNG